MKKRGNLKAKNTCYRITVGNSWENTRLVPWPIDKLWVTKGERFVVKTIEWRDNIQVEYVLEIYSCALLFRFH